MRIGNPLPVSLPQESIKATKIFKSFVNSNSGLDGLIPSQVLRSAYGFAIFTMMKAGFVMSVRGGTGVVVARLADGGWTAPSAIGIGGMGIGGQVGAEVAEIILVLNSKSAVTQFMSAGSITLGGNLSLALGPIGRNAEGAGALNNKGKLAAVYSYSKTRGVFAGLSVEGSAIFQRHDCNLKAYGSHVTATKLLSGHIDMPPWAEDLARVLTVCAGSYTEYVNRDLPLQLPRNSSIESDQEISNNNNNNNNNNAIIAERTNFTRQKNEFLDRELFSSPPPAANEPYTFGLSYASSGSSSHPLPPPKSQTKKSLFSVATWKLNSLNSSVKTSHSSAPSRQNTPPPSHWIDNIKSNSPQLSESHQRTHSSTSFNSPLPSFIHPRSIPEDSKSYDEEKQSSSRMEDEIRSLSSIGSGSGSDQEEEGGRMQDWDHSNHQEIDQVTGISFELNKSDSNRRNWFDSIQTTHHLVSKPNVFKDELHLDNGIIDDLISFDLIAPPSPLHCLDHSAHSLESSDTLGTNTNTNPNKIETKSPLNHETLNLNPKEEDEEDKDFLVGTQMPSVSRTQTELAGYMGKATAKFDFIGDQPGDLSFKKGDVILILQKIDEQWSLGSIGLHRGIFPVNRVSPS